MRDFMRYTRTWEKLAILGILFITVFGSCKIVDNIRDLQSEVQKYRTIYEANKGNIDKTIQAIAKGLDAASIKIISLDKDMDGKISLQELLMAFGGALGLMQSRNVISNRKKRDDKTAIWRALDEIKKSPS